MSSDDPDEDPSHINQILCESSGSAVLEAIQQLGKYSSNQTDSEPNMVFSSKVDIDYEC